VWGYQGGWGLLFVSLGKGGGGEERCVIIFLCAPPCSAWLWTALLLLLPSLLLWTFLICVEGEGKNTDAAVPGPCTCAAEMIVAERGDVLAAAQHVAEAAQEVGEIAGAHPRQ
jgi:hypothetical protein